MERLISASNRYIFCFSSSKISAITDIIKFQLSKQLQASLMLYWVELPVKCVFTPIYLQFFSLIFVSSHQKNQCFNNSDCFRINTFTTIVRSLHKTMQWSYKINQYFNRSGANVLTTCFPLSAIQSRLTGGNSVEVYCSFYDT